MTNKETVTIQTKNGDVSMKRMEYARWLCLLEALDLVNRKAQELKADLNSDDFWVKPLSFQKYIDQRLETMVIDIDREEFNMSIGASIQANKDLFKKPEEVEEAEEEEDVEVGSEAWEPLATNQ